MLTYFASNIKVLAIMNEILGLSDTLLLASTVMTAGLFSSLIGVVVTAGLVLACAHFFKGVHVENFTSSLILAVIVGIATSLLSIFNFDWLSAITLGISSLVISTVALILADKLMESVRFDNYWWALAIALVLSLAQRILPVVGVA